jgi:hypothetical protein
VLQVFLSYNLWQTYSIANSDSMNPRPWAAVSYSADGSTVAAVSASEDNLRRVAVRVLGTRVASTAERLIKQAKRTAPAQADQYNTVWIGRYSGSSWFPTTPTPSQYSYFMDVALSADGERLVAVQRGGASSSTAGIYTAAIAGSVWWSSPVNMGVDEWCAAAC